MFSPKGDICEVMGVLTKWEEFFQNVYTYQIIMRYTCFKDLTIVFVSGAFIKLKRTE